MITWKPHPKQELFSSLPDVIFEGLYGGAAGGGKSDELVMLPMIRGFYKEPQFKGILFRRTYPELESEIIQRSRDWYPHFGGTYNESLRRWKFASGSSIQFGHCEHENDIRKYDTAEYQYAAFDELTSFTEFQYKYFVYSRMRTKSNTNLPVIARSATNPGNIGHAWVRNHFINPAPWGTIIRDKQTGLQRIFIQACATDNPHVDKGYIARMMALPEAERRAKLDGDWYTFEGQVFSDFRENKIPGEPENALHVIPSFEIPTWWNHILAIDWGYNAFTVALWAALSPQNRLYIFREYAHRNKRVAEWSSEIGRLSSDLPIKRAALCRSAWQDRGEDNAVVSEKFQKYSGIAPEPAKNDRLLGKITLQEFLRWTPKPTAKSLGGEYDEKQAQKILRHLGTDAYIEYVNSFKDEETETNLPKLQILKDQAPGLVNAIPLCIYGKADNKGKPSEDVQEFDGDDFYDCVRYLVCEADDLMGELAFEGNKRSSIADVVANFERNKDQTTYYRQMELLERRNRESDPEPVRRFHRRF